MNIQLKNIKARYIPIEIGRRSALQLAIIRSAVCRNSHGGFFFIK